MGAKRLSERELKITNQYGSASDGKIFSRTDCMLGHKINPRNIYQIEITLDTMEQT